MSAKRKYRACVRIDGDHVGSAASNDMHWYLHASDEEWEKRKKAFDGKASTFGGAWYYVELTEEECEHL